MVISFYRYYGSKVEEFSPRLCNGIIVSHYPVVGSETLITCQIITLLSPFRFIIIIIQLSKNKYER